LSLSSSAMLLYNSLPAQDQLLPEDQRRRDRRTPRISIQRWSTYSLQYLIASHSIPRPVVFGSWYGVSTARRLDELREIDAVGLVLYWFRNGGSVAKASCMAFGLTSTPMYKWLQFSRRVLRYILQKHPLAAVTPPTDLEITVLRGPSQGSSSRGSTRHGSTTSEGCGHYS